MRKTLSDLIAQSVLNDPKVVVLTGDHGYSLFDQVRSLKPKQFINVGIAEQAMIGIASGMAKEGYKPICYGLASFVPMRCLEQIKLDVCYFNLPVKIIGDGAGLVYSKLGPSHQCAEDLACLMPMPNLRVYTPADGLELEVCWEDSNNKGPSYFRIGKEDRTSLQKRPIRLEGYPTHLGSQNRPAILAHGSMVSIATNIAKRLDISCYAYPRLKPYPTNLPDCANAAIVIEEHSKHGGLASLIHSATGKFYGICLQDKFSDKCGDYQYALSEHQMDDEALYQRVQRLI